MYMASQERCEGGAGRLASRSECGRAPVLWSWENGYMNGRARECVLVGVKDVQG